ncbi:hypothetical protein QR680_003320 [Steinernema hermaphroditum]|uniref:Uncharacterized protein n=1 Tax=Steinernema hermaphroditum TaxID=289476 RepID=A0AA39H6B4_9BILA|nr:hypothetical protein QR680_003320 [Steinernema hermaphroditum]
MSRTDSQRLLEHGQQPAASSEVETAPCTSFTSDPSTSFSSECGQIAKLVKQHEGSGSNMKNVKEIVAELCKNPDKINYVLGLLKDTNNEALDGRKVTRSMTRNEAAVPTVNFRPIQPPLTFLDLNFAEDDDEEYIPDMEPAADDPDDNTFFSQSDIDSESTVSAMNRTYQLRSHSRILDFPECILEEDADDPIYLSRVDNDDYINFINNTFHDSELDLDDPDDPDFVPTELDEYDNEQELNLNIPTREKHLLLSDIIDVPQQEPPLEQCVQEETPPHSSEMTCTVDTVLTSDTLVNIKDGHIPKFTDEERNQLKDQMAMHVQQLMQTVMITYDTDGLHEDHNEALQMMQDLVTAANTSPLSHFAVANVPSAVETLENFLSQLVVWPDIFSNELFKSHLWQFPSHKVMWTLANSSAVLYPELLIVQRAQAFREPYNKFIESENLLLAMALLQFNHVKHSSCANRTGKNHLIAKLMLANKTSSQIKYHMKNIRNKTSEVYQLITKAEKSRGGERIEFPRFTYVRIDEGPPLQWDPECPVQPFWLKELRKSLFSQSKHRTVTELPRNAVIQIQYDTPGSNVVEHQIAENNENVPVESVSVQCSKVQHVPVQAATIELQTSPSSSNLTVRQTHSEASVCKLDITSNKPEKRDVAIDDEDTDVTEILEEGHVPICQSTPKKNPVHVNKGNRSEKDKWREREMGKQPTVTDVATEPSKVQTQDKGTSMTEDQLDDVIITETDITFEEVCLDETFEADISICEEIDISEMNGQVEAQLNKPSITQSKPFCPRNEDSLLWVNNDEDGLTNSTFRIQTPRPYEANGTDPHEVLGSKTPTKVVDPWADDSCSVPAHLRTPNFSKECEQSVQITPKKKSTASRRIFEIDPPDVQESNLLSPVKKASSRRKETDFERARCVNDHSRRSDQMAILSQIIWEDIRVRLFMHDHVLVELQKVVELNSSAEDVLRKLGKVVEKQHDAVLYLIAFLIPQDLWPTDLRNNHTCLNMRTALQRILVVEAFHAKAVRRSAIKNIFTAVARLGDGCSAQQLFDKLNKHFGSHKILWSQLEELFPDACFNKRVLPNEYEQYNLYDSDHGEDVEQYEKIDINSALGKMSHRVPHSVSIDRGRVYVRQNGRQVQVDFSSLAEENSDRTTSESNAKRRRQSNDKVKEIRLQVADTVVQHYSEQHQQNSTYGNRIPWAEENDDAMIVCLERLDYKIDESVQMYIKEGLHAGTVKPSADEIKTRMTLLRDLVSDYIATKERTSITLR